MGFSGGGGSQTTTVDPAYNAGLLELFREEQGWAGEMYNMFKYGVLYDPNEEVEGRWVDGEFIEKDKLTPEQMGSEAKYVANPQAAGPKNMGEYYKDQDKWDKLGHYESKEIPGSGTQWGGQYYPDYENVWVSNEDVAAQQLDPNYKLETATRGEIMGYNADDQVSELEYLQRQVEANAKLLGLETDVRKAQLESQKTLIPKRTELAKTYFDDINKGLDITGRMDEAQAAVQHGFKGAREAGRMDISSFGLDPSAGRYAAINRGTELAEATGVAAARTKAKTEAEKEDFARKTAGLSLSV